MPDPATDDIIPLRILSLLPASNLMSVVRDFSNHSYMRAYISSAYYFENASYKNSIHPFISSLPLLFVISIIRKISWLLKKRKNVETLFFSSSLFRFFFCFSRVNFSQAKTLSSRKNFIIFSSTDFYTPSSVTIRLCIYVLRNNKNDPRRNF